MTAIVERVITILVADDHPTARESLRDMLHSVRGMRCTSTASTATHAIDLAVAHGPDVVVMGLSALSEVVSATQQIRRRCPSTGVLVLSGWDGAELRRQTAAAGASAHLLKGCDPDLLVRAIKHLAAA